MRVFSATFLLAATLTSLTLLLQTYQSEAASAAAIAYCPGTGNGGLGRSGRSDESHADNIAKANIEAINNCIAAGGRHGCCHIRTKTDSRSQPRCIALVKNNENDFFTGGGKSRRIAVSNAKDDCGGFCNAVASVCVDKITSPRSNSAIGRRLKASEVAALLTEQLERGTLIKPTKPRIEGRAKTSYTAYYFANGRMLYERDGSRKGAQLWQWRVDKRGNLCRGPLSPPKRYCRAIEKLGNGHYRAVGYRSGKTRYEFFLRNGSPDELNVKAR